MSDNDGAEETAGDDRPPEAEGDRDPDEAGDAVTVDRDTEGTGESPKAEDTNGADESGTDTVDEEAGEFGEADASGEELGPTGTSLVAKVAIEDGALADDVEDHLRELVAERERAEERAAEAEERVEELKSKVKRTQADFQNYKKRAKRRQEEIRGRATADLVERLLSVRDDLVRAVEDDHDDVASLREGVKLTLEEFDRVLDAEDVTEIAPEPGDEVDPQRHEVMLRVESDQPEDAVADVHRSGFEMAGTVLRPAQVTVSEGPDDDEDAGENGGQVDEGDVDGADQGDADGADHGDADEADEADDDDVDDEADAGTADEDGDAESGE